MTTGAWGATQATQPATTGDQGGQTNMLDMKILQNIK